MRQAKGLLVTFLSVSLMVGVVGGCAQKKPEVSKATPRQENSQGQNQPSHKSKYTKEPTISLYVNETKEKKQVKLEEYLQGVVAAEMDPKWPVEALAAQAILARTFTLENIEAGRVKKLRGTDASTSVEEFQAYDPSKINDKVKKAVAMTRGEVAFYQDRYIHAWFHACCANMTATAQEGLAYNKEPTPYIQPVKDDCLSITVPENKHWQVSFSLDQVKQAMLKQAGKTPNNLTAISIAKKGASGRVETFKVGDQTISGPALRLGLGSDKVRSMKLDGVSVAGGKVTFSGKGYGHGVGMCQWGAHKFATEGKKPEEIVKHYFKGIKIEKLY